MFVVNVKCMALSAFDAQEVLFLKYLMTTCGAKITKRIRMMEVNQRYIALPTKPLIARKTKHIDIRYHVVLYFIISKVIRMQWCET